MSDSMQMSEEAGMNVCVNGESKVPPGFRFHPTEEELLVYYLRKKVGCEKIDLDVIRDVDLNKLEPWDIQEKCKIGSTPQNDWYFFSHKDKKYPTGTRTNRATAAGFWKATGRDKVIYSSFKRIGMRKTLVFYKGRAPNGQKSDWIMHEYRLDDTASCNHDPPPPPSTPASTAANNNNLALAAGETAASASEAGWVVCRVFKKKNYHKALESPQYSTSSTIYSNIMDTRTTHIPNSKNQDPILDQILHYMGKSCKQENETNILLNFTSIHPTTSLLGTFRPKFSHLPRLDSVSSLPSPKGDGHSIFRGNEIFIESSSGVEQATACSNTNTIDGHNNIRQLSDWVALDHLVASQLNCQDDDTSNHLSCYNDLHENVCFSHIDHDLQIPHIHSNKPYFQPNSQVYSSEIDLWSCFTRSPPSSSSSGPLGDVSI